MFFFFLIYRIFQTQTLNNNLTSVEFIWEINTTDGLKNWHEKAIKFVKMITEKAINLTISIFGFLYDVSLLLREFFICYNEILFILHIVKNVMQNICTSPHCNKIITSIYSSCHFSRLNFMVVFFINRLFDEKYTLNRTKIVTWTYFMHLYKNSYKSTSIFFNQTDVFTFLHT